MARPWESSLIEGAAAELKRLHIGMVLNLQETGEHSRCGPGILSDSGFSYRPETVMAAGVAVYHMCWPDMCTPTLPQITRIVQVRRSQLRRGATFCESTFADSSGHDSLNLSVCLHVQMPPP